MNLNKLKTNYEPRKIDLEWTESALDIFSTGQYWMTSFYTVLVDKENRLIKVVRVRKGKEAKENLARLIKVLQPSRWEIAEGLKEEIETFQNYRADFAYFNAIKGVGYLGSYN